LHKRPLLFIAFLLFSPVAFRSAQQIAVPAPPSTPKHPVTDEYHGVKVADDYRWLENWSDPAVKQWSAAQNLRTRGYLDQLPARGAIKERLQQLFAGSSAKYYDLQYCAGIIFAMKAQPPKQQPMLVTLRSAGHLASEHVLVDPNALSAKGSIAIDFYSPSIDGKLVAVSLSENGSEDGTAHIFEVASGKELSDKVPRVNFPTAGGSIAWKADGSGFYYTRYPQGDERPKEDANFYQQVYFHKLGSESTQDTYLMGKEFPRIAEVLLTTDRAGQYLLASVANGDGGAFAHYLMNSSGHWTQVTHFEDQVVSAKFGEDRVPSQTGAASSVDGSLYLLSRNQAPRGKVLRVHLANPRLDGAEVIVPQSKAVGSADASKAGASIEEIAPAWDRLFVVDIAGGPSDVRVFARDGRAFGKLPVPPVSSVEQVVPLEAGNVLFYVASYLEPPAWYQYDGKTGNTAPTAMLTTSAAQFDDAEVVREFAVSKDGTHVPLNIIRRKGTKLDGNNPTLLEAYGGYGVSLSPFFVGPLGRMWLDAGGVYVIANLRGGGEYGEEWHEAGKLTKKQNVFDDFAASAQHLIARRHTSPEHLAIIGGSNGGLLMGGAFTQHPELFRAVVSFVGIYDMLRVELDPNGAFNTTEFGSVKDPEQFKALYAYSPYHHVKDGTAYPAILFLTGDNDGRVNPMQSRKMIARLQAANASGNPILLRTTANAGHGIGTALGEKIEQYADVMSFLFDQMGIEYRPAAKASN
jgi:prolyl oligopeptidase